MPTRQIAYGLKISLCIWCTNLAQTFCGCKETVATATELNQVLKIEHSNRVLNSEVQCCYNFFKYPPRSSLYLEEIRRNVSKTIKLVLYSWSSKMYTLLEYYECISSEYIAINFIKINSAI